MLGIGSAAHDDGDDGNVSTASINRTGGFPGGSGSTGVDAIEMLRTNPTLFPTSAMFKTEAGEPETKAGAVIASTADRPMTNSPAPSYPSPAVPPTTASTHILDVLLVSSTYPLVNSDSNNREAND